MKVLTRNSIIETIVDDESVITNCVKIDWNFFLNGHRDLAVSPQILNHT